MKILHQRFRTEYHYPVYFTEDLFESGNECLPDFFSGYTNLQKDIKVLIVVDDGLLSHFGQLGNKILSTLQAIPGVNPVNEIIVIPGGERAKNEGGFLEIIHDAVNNNNIDRHSFVMAVGGGSVLDLAGYASAIAHRGIRHIRVPTTVLSQNDSGVGVKNGINYFGKKNFLGTFEPPVAVFDDSKFLTTLNDRDWRSGIAEAVKVSLIKDREFYEWLEDHIAPLNARDLSVMKELIYRCAQLHLNHIASGDPFESGSSRPLDFGHWSAHKMEQLSGFELRHGEAVAIGMAIDVIYSELIGWLDGKSVRRIIETLRKFNFALYHPSMENRELLDGISEFREHLGGDITIMMLREIGKGDNVHSMDPKLIAESLERLKQEQLTVNGHES